MNHNRLSAEHDKKSRPDRIIRVHNSLIQVTIIPVKDDL
jgi:hypothetical protein